MMAFSCPMARFFCSSFHVPQIPCFPHGAWPPPWPSPKVWPPIEPLEIRRPVMSVGSQVHGLEAQTKMGTKPGAKPGTQKVGWNQEILPEKQRVSYWTWRKFLWFSYEIYMKHGDMFDSYVNVYQRVLTRVS